MDAPASLDTVIIEIKHMLTGTFPDTGFFEWTESAARICHASEKYAITRMAHELTRLRTEVPTLVQAPGIVKIFVEGVQAHDIDFGYLKALQAVTAIPKIISGGTAWYTRSQKP